MVSNSISIDREKDSELLQVQEFLETLKNNPDQVINSVIKKEYLELLNIAFENAKTDQNLGRSVFPELLKLGILGKEDKEKYLELLNIAFENAKTSGYWAEYVLPELLKLGIVEKEELQKALLTKEKPYRLFEILFLQKHSQKLSAQDLIQFWNLDAILTWEEKQFLCKQTYDDFLTLQKEVEKKNYQALWQFKCNLYPKEEQQKLARLKDYFWDEVWIYFFDKVHTERDLKNRFRDPHNALLHSDKIIQLAQELEKKGISKSDFIKNYLGIAGDRNSGYQQLNDFLIKYTSNWQDLIIKELNDPQGLWDPAFVECVQRILDQDKTGELYQNLDSLEQITTVLKIIKSKESLIKLQKLAVSNDPQD